MDINKLLCSEELMLGIEFGNRSGTFSANKSDDLDLKKANGIFVTSTKKLNNIEILIRDTRLLQRNIFTRNIIIESKNNISLYDFVSRFVISTKSKRPAKINGRDIQHCSSNIYYQEKANYASIPLDEKRSIIFENLNSNEHKGFDNVIYIRDESKQNNNHIWVVHHRLISNNKDKVLIGCNRICKGEIKFQRFFPNLIKKPLYRIREKSFSNFPFMTINETNIKSKMKLSIQTNIQIKNE